MNPNGNGSVHLSEFPVASHHLLLSAIAAAGELITLSTLRWPHTLVIDVLWFPWLHPLRLSVISSYYIGSFPQMPECQRASKGRLLVCMK